MEPPPLPSSSGRFRLRIQIYPPHEAHNLSAAPLRQFTIVKTPALSLPDLTLQELCDEVVKRFKAIYQGESLFTVDKSQDSYGSDLYFGDRVRDIFEDNEIFRVIKGATSHASVEPHRVRSQSVQPNGSSQCGSARVTKRNHGHLEAENSILPHKRQKVVPDDPDHPINSNEFDTIGENGGEVQLLEEYIGDASIVHDSQKAATDLRSGQDFNTLSQEFTKVAGVKSNRPHGSSSLNSRHRNLVATSSASHQRIPASPSVTSSRDEVATSDSDPLPAAQRALSRSKRKSNIFIDDFSEQDGRHSISTAMTTPQSVLQQPNNQSPMIDNKKLRRPATRAGKNNADDVQRAQIFPRQNIYEVIETDTERMTRKSASQDVSSKISNSSKWKAYRSSATPISNKSSPRQPMSSATEREIGSPGDQESNDGDELQTPGLGQQSATETPKQHVEKERSKLAFETEEKRHLEAENRGREPEAKLKVERLAAEKFRREIEAQQALAKEQTEAEERMKRDASARAKAEEAEAKAAEKAKIEAELRAKLEEQKKAADEEERQAMTASKAENLRLEFDAVKTSEKEKSLREQALLRAREEKGQRSLTLAASLEATVRRAASTPAKAATSHSHSTAEAIRSTSTVSPAPTGGAAFSKSRRVSCTPFIPRGRPSESTPPALHRTEANAAPLLRASTPDVGLENQMPMPPQVKRKVSFVDQEAPSSERKIRVASSTLKQSTLVPARLATLNIKGTPKRTPLKMKATSSRSSKGKAKVMESPGKPPGPTIETSSDEESVTSSRRPVSKRSIQNYTESGSPGPADHNPVAGQARIRSKSRPSTETVVLNQGGENDDNMNEQEAKNAGNGCSSPTQPTSMDSEDVTFPDDKACSARKPHSCPAGSVNSISVAPLNILALCHQTRSLTEANNSLEEPRTPDSGRNKQTKSSCLKIMEKGGFADGGSENELDSLGTPNTSESGESLPPVSGDEDDSRRLPENYCGVSGGEDEEKSDSDESHDGPQQLNTQKPFMNQHRDCPTDLEMNTEDEIPNVELELRSVNSKPDRQDEPTNEELEKHSDSTQDQLDDQLLSQSFGSSSPFRPPPKVVQNSNIQPIATKAPRIQQDHALARPSLRRMNMEAQRTKEANKEAAKARGLEKAQKLQASVRAAGLLVESSGDGSSSESNSSFSEDESDDQKLMVNNRPNMLTVGKPSGSSPARASALKPPSKGLDLMFEPAASLQQNANKTSGKKSAKIGWSKLGKQFSASKHKGNA